MDMAKTVGWTLSIASCNDPNQQLTIIRRLLGKPSKIIWSWIWCSQIAGKLQETYWPVRNLDVFQSLKPCFQNCTFTSWWCMTQKNQNLQPKRFVSQVIFQPPPKPIWQKLCQNKHVTCCLVVPRCLKRCSIRTTRWDPSFPMGRFCYLQRFLSEISLAEMPW